MNFFMAFWYILTGLFTGKFMWAFKSEEEIQQLKEEGMELVLCTMKFQPDISKRQARKAMKKLLGRKCNNVIDTYRGFRLCDFFREYPPISRVVSDTLANATGMFSSVPTITVMLKGPIAGQISECFKYGRIYSEIPGMTVKVPGNTPWDVRLRYDDIISFVYSNSRTKLHHVPEKCPECHNRHWILQEDNSCDECHSDVSEHIVFMEGCQEGDIQGMEEEMEAFRIENNEDLLEDYRAA